MPVGIDQAGRGEVTANRQQALGIIQGLVSWRER